MSALVGLVFAAPRDGRAGPIIPPGRDAMLGEMLGAGPGRVGGRCAFDGASVKRSFVQASYRCGDAGDVTVSLMHPGAAKDAARRTDRFAISVVSGTAADAAFLDDLASRVRAREAAWEWANATDREPANGTAGGGRPAASSDRLVGAVALAAALATGVALARRRAKPR